MKKDHKDHKDDQPTLAHKELTYNAKLLKNEEWLTTEEVMDHLNISRSTLYRLRKQQHLPSFKLGRIPMYPKHLLNQLFSFLYQIFYMVWNHFY